MSRRSPKIRRGFPASIERHLKTIARNPSRYGDRRAHTNLFEALLDMLIYALSGLRGLGYGLRQNVGRPSAHHLTKETKLID